MNTNLDRQSYHIECLHLEQLKRTEDEVWSIFYSIVAIVITFGATETIAPEVHSQTSPNDTSFFAASIEMELGGSGIGRECCASQQKGGAGSSPSFATLRGGQYVSARD